MTLEDAFEVLSAYYGSNKKVADALFYSPQHYRRLRKRLVPITKTVESYIILKALAAIFQKESTQQKPILAKNSREEVLT